MPTKGDGTSEGNFEAEDNDLSVLQGTISERFLEPMRLPPLQLKTIK